MTNFFDEQVATLIERPMASAIARPFWRKDQPDILNGRVTRGGMWPHQKQWWDLPNFIRVLVGGYGAGKTSILCKRMITLALMNAPCPVELVSPTFPIAQKTTIPTLLDLLSGKQSILGRELWWRYHKTFHEFHVSYHGRNGLISIKSGEDPLSLRGPNLAAAGIDEPFIQVEEVFHQMIARVRHPYAKKMEICMVGTPEELNWGYDLCLGELREKNDVGFIQASTRMNLAIAADYAVRLESILSPKAARAFVGGEFVALTEGQVYYGFNSLENNIRELPIPDGAELGVGMDFNVQPMAAVVFWRLGQHIHLFDEIELDNADTEYMCSFLNDKYNNRQRPYKSEHGYPLSLTDVYPDASGGARHTSSPEGKSDFWYLEKAGFTINARHANPKRKERYNAVNGKLAPKSAPVGRFGIRPSLTVAPSCKKLIKYFTLYSHEKLNDAKHKRMSHLLDAATYPVSYLFPVDGENLHVTPMRS